MTRCTWRTVWLFLGFLASLQGVGCNQGTCDTNKNCSTGQYCNLATHSCKKGCASDKDCKTPQTCKLSEGKCTDSNCKIEATKKCVQAALYWFDSCDKQGQKIKDCGSAGCSNGACQGSQDSCSNGVCEPGLEDCASCPQDCKCQAGETCNNGSCCVSGCKDGQVCGTNSCGESCGTCPAHTACQIGKCECLHECIKTSATRCLTNKTYKICKTDEKGCRYWSTSQACPSGGDCTNDSCCQRQCADKECGKDGCGGNCGTCSYACASDRCQRKLLVAKIFLPCKLCDDAIRNKEPDPFIKLTLSNGKTFESKKKDNVCDTSITFQWSVDKLDPNLLKNATIEIIDYDLTTKNDLCVSWKGDFSIGKKVLKKDGATLSIEVTK